MSQTAMPRTRVAVREHPLVGADLRAVLVSAPELEFAGSYLSLPCLEASLWQSTVDVIVLACGDARHRPDRFSWLRALCRRHPQVRMLVASNDARPEVRVEAMLGGAHGFFLVRRPAADLVAAVQLVAQGYVYPDIRAAHSAINAAAPVWTADSHAVWPAVLSAREREVIRCYLQGMTITEIACRYSRSVKTISSQKASAYQKLGVTSYAELYRLLAQRGLC